MKFKLEIELGNDAMQTYGDIRGALGSLNLPSAARHPKIDYDKGKVRDDNGNTVGTWKIIGD